MLKKKEQFFQRTYGDLPEGACICEIGCLGFQQFYKSQKLSKHKLQHFGVDYASSDTLPPGFTFKLCDLNKNAIPFEDDMFDLVVAEHVIEHIKDPVSFFQDIVRIVKPGGLIYLEAPSERSLFLPGMPFKHEHFHSLSFWDDPTHMGRPFSPQALYRLAKYTTCEPQAVGYLVNHKQRWLFPLKFLYALIFRDPNRLETSLWNAVGWAAILIAQKSKNLSGAPEFHYYYPESRMPKNLRTV